MLAVGVSEGSTSQMHPFQFNSDGLDHGASALGLTIEYKDNYISSYTYNEVTRTYDRFFNGEPYVDANNNVQCSYANVLVVRTDISWYRNYPSRPVVQLVGQGTLEVFQNGRYIRGTWVRAKDNNASDSEDLETLAQRMVFFDDQGNELQLMPARRTSTSWRTASPSRW